MTQLRSGFISEPKSLDWIASPPVGRKRPSYGAPEVVLPEAERTARAALWYANHWTPPPMSCAEAWPPIPLE